MPSREEMLAELRASKAKPSREQMLAELRQAKKPKSDQFSTGEAALQGYGQGLFMGYLPHLQAKAEPVADRIANMFIDDKYQDEPAPWSQMFSNDENYIKSRDEAIERDKIMAEESPKAHMAGQVGGAVNMGFLVPGGGAKNGGQILAKLAAKSPAAARIVQGAAMGGAYGAAANPGDVEGEINALQVNDRLKNALVGTATGGVAQGGIEAGGKALGAFGKWLKKLAERRAAAGMGAERGTIKKIGADKVQEIGRYGLDEGVLSPNTDKMISRNEAMKNKGGNMMSEVYDSIDEVMPESINPVEMAGKVDKKAGDFWRSPINRGEASQLDNTLDAILMRSGLSVDELAQLANPRISAKKASAIMKKMEGKISLKEAQKLKQELGKVANWKNNLTITDKEKMARDAYGVASKMIDEAADAGAEKIGRAELPGMLKEGKRLYSMGKGAEEILTNKLAREQGNKMTFGLTDTIAGAGAYGATGDPGVTMAAMGGKKLLERYGNFATAKLADAASKILMKSPELAKLANTNPAAFQALVNQFVTQRLEKQPMTAGQ